MNKITVSVVITIKNEEKSIAALLDGLAGQSRPVDEVILVDGGSSDKTLDRVERWKAKHELFPVHIYEQPGANRSQGRNYGIEQAKGDIIAVTDAGCVPEESWLEKLTGPFSDANVMTVAGYYAMAAQNSWQIIFSWYLGVLPENFDSLSYLPSSRSLAFRTKVLNQVGGYPEKLSTCEDLVFAKRLKDYGHMVMAPGAKVLWFMPQSKRMFFDQISGYARGDIEAKYLAHVKKIISVWIRYGVIILWPPLFFVYWFFPLFKWRHKLKAGMVYQVIVAQLLADMGVLWGSARGFLGRGTNQP